MWSYNRRAFMLSAVALAGCGFTPVYGPDGPGRLLYGQVALESPSSENTYTLTQYLTQRLGRADAPRYGLTTSVARSQQGLAVTASQVTVRYNVLGDMSYALRDLDSGQVIASGKVSATTSYSASGTTVATQAARSDANKRLMIALADLMIDRLAVDLAEAQ